MYTQETLGERSTPFGPTYKKDTIMKLVSLVVIMISLGAIACEEAPPASPSPKLEVEAAKVEALPEKSKAELAAEGKLAAEESKRKADEEKAQAELAKNPLTECCRALGKKGYTERSMEYMGASKVCGAGMTEGKSLAEISASMKKELKGKSLPEECAN